MSDDIKRIHGWAVNTPIPMRGGDVAYVVSKIGPEEDRISGYRLDNIGQVYGMSWLLNGRFLKSDSGVFDLDPSYRVLPESELPLWTMKDSQALLGKFLRENNVNRYIALIVMGVYENASIEVFYRGILQRMTYCQIQNNYCHLDGSQIPQRRMP